MEKNKLKMNPMREKIQNLMDKRKGITLPIRTIIIVVLILIGLAFIAIMAAKAKGQGTAGVEALLKELKETLG